MEEEDDRLAYYIEIGAVEIAGVDESGELIFQINESAKEVAPELWQAHMNYIDESLMELYRDGYIDIEYNEDLEAIVNLSEEGYRIALEKGIIPIDMPEIPDN